MPGGGAGRCLVGDVVKEELLELAECQGIVENVDRLELDGALLVIEGAVQDVA